MLDKYLHKLNSIGNYEVLKFQFSLDDFRFIKKKLFQDIKIIFIVFYISFGIFGKILILV